MNQLSVQLEIALQSGQISAWEYDPVRDELTWFERSSEGPVSRTEAMSDWITKVHPDDQALLIAALNEAARSGQLDFNYRLFSPAGVQHRIHAQGKAKVLNRRIKIVGISIDVTGQQRAETRLQAQQAVTKALEEWTTLEEVSARILQVLCETQEWEIGNMWSHDPQSDQLVLVQSWANDGMEAPAQALTIKQRFPRGVGLPGRVWASGRPAWIEDVRGDGNLMRFASAKDFGIRSALACPIHLGPDFFGVMEFFSKRARRENPEVVAMLEAVASQFSQVIERRRAERELRESEEQHRTISETAPDAILTIDGEGKVVFANPAVEQIFGYHADEVVGKNITMLIPARLPIPFRKGEARHLRATVKGAEMPGLHKNGSELRLELSFGEFERDSKHFIIAVARDIGPRKQGENALKSSEKLAATGRLAASMVHEINNPLTAVDNVLYLLDSDPAMSPQNRKLVETAQQELQRVTHIVKQTLGFYRQSNEPVDTDLVEIMDGVLQLFVSQLKSRQIRVVRRYETTRKVKSLPAEMRQVASNLIENAIQALQPGGELVVHLRDSTDPRNPLRNGVRLVVADSGSGIRRENRKKIFEPFFTTKGERGTGLGLWVTRGIIEKHGGSIRLRSSTRPEKSGTYFSVFLPSTPEAIGLKAA